VGSPEESGSTPIQVLVVETIDHLGRHLEQDLRARGVEVTLATNITDAVRTLRGVGADLTVLGVPIPGIDSVACCAALKEGAAPPPLILLDATGQAADLEVSLPRGMRPDALLPRPVDSTKLLLEIHEILERVSVSGMDAPPGGLHISLPEILIDLGERAETGILDIRADGVCTSIHLHRGNPVFAEGGSLHDTLGRLLLRRGEIGESEYVRVIERMTERLVDNEPLRMGEVLVELGMLTPNEVYDALVQQVSEKIIACFRWTSFTHSFHPLETVPEEILAFEVPSLEALLLAGLKAHFGPGRVELLLRPHSNRYPVLRMGAAETGNRFQMNPAEQKFLLELRGERTVAQLQQHSSLDAAHAGQVLAALVVAREVALKETPSAAKPAKPDRSSSKPRTPSAPARATGTAEATGSQHHDLQRRRRDPLGQLSSRLEKMPGFKTPTQPVDERQAKLEAERTFRGGMVLLLQNMLPGAHREFVRASELQPSEPEYRMYEAWVSYLTTREEEGRTLARAKASACANRVLQDHRESSRAHSILGQLAQSTGELEAAERHFRMALRYDPDDLDAQRGLRLLSNRRPPS
jgi:CheY-like chemotaxis protein/tetratricopeptide (TPR) repeat protein